MSPEKIRGRRSYRYPDYSREKPKNRGAAEVNGKENDRSRACGTTFVLVDHNEGTIGMTRLTDDGRVEFRFFRPDARDVRIAGDFNGWDRGSMSMESEGNGWWKATAEIEGGDHRFRYYADGQWYTDYAANGVEQNKLGWNSILTVPSARKRAERVMDEIEHKPEKKTQQNNKAKLVA
jgi:1,4-alpha-glucan branching enzyme